jgi:hypothetical protein
MNVAPSPTIQLFSASPNTGDEFDPAMMQILIPICRRRNCQNCQFWRFFSSVRGAQDLAEIAMRPKKDARQQK